MEGRGLRQKRGRQNWVDEEELESSSGEFTDADAEPDYSDDEDSRRGRLAVRWEGQIEARFLKALQQAGGVWEAKPKAILQKMGAYASQLTTIQVKSHLQKHRIKVAAEMQRTGATLATPAGADAPAPLAAARAAAAAQAAAAAVRQAAVAAAAAVQHKPRQPKAAAAAGSGAKAAARGAAAASTGGRARKHQKQAPAAAQQQPPPQQAAAWRQQPQHAPSTPQRVRFEAAPQYHQQQQAAAQEGGDPHREQLQQQHLHARMEAQAPPQAPSQAALHARHYVHAHHSHPHAGAAFPARQQLPLHSSHGPGQHLAAPSGQLLLDPSYPAPSQESPPTDASGSSSAGGLIDAWEAGLLSVSAAGSTPPRYSSYGSAAHQQHAATGMASPVRHGSLMRGAPTPLAPQGTAPAAFWAGAGLGAEGWPGLAADPPPPAPRPAAAHPPHGHAYAAASAMAAAAANPAADPAAPVLLAGSPLLAGPGGAPHTSDSDSDHFHADPDIAELLDMPLPEAMLRPSGAADPLVFGYGLDARHASWALDSGIF